MPTFLKVVSIDHPLGSPFLMGADFFLNQNLVVRGWSVYEYTLWPKALDLIPEPRKAKSLFGGVDGPSRHTLVSFQIRK